MAGNDHGVLCGDAACGIGRGNLAHGHTHHAGRAHAKGSEQVRQCNLNGGNGHLGGLGVIGLGIVVDDIQDGPAGLKVHDGIQLFQASLELRRERNHVLRHLAVLGSKTGVNKYWPRNVRGIRSGNADGDLAFSYLAQALDRFLGGASRHDGAGAGVVAAGDSSGDVDKRGLFRLNEVCQQGRSACPARRQKARDRQRDRFGGKLRRAFGRGTAVIGEYDVRIGAAETKARHTRNLAPRVLGPLARILDYLEVLGLEIDITIRRRVIDIGRNYVIAHGLDDLDKADHSRGGFRVADIGLGRAEQNRSFDPAARTEYAAQGGGLDRIAQNGAGAVGLNIVHVLRIYARISIGAAQHVLLCLRVRGGQAIGVAIGVDGRALEDGQDIVAIGFRVLQALEHEDAGGVGTHDAIGVVGKSVNGTRWRGNSQLREGRGRMRGGQDIHATGQRHVRTTRAQILHRQVHRYEGGRAGRIHVDGGAAEIQGIRNAVSNHSRGNSGQRIRVHLGGISADEHAVVIIGRSHVHAGLRSPQLIGGNTSVF